MRPCSGWGLPCHPRYRGRGGLLPHRFTLTRRPLAERPGGLFSVALSSRSPSPGVTRHPALWSSDFPPAGLVGLAPSRTCRRSSVPLRPADDTHPHPPRRARYPSVFFFFFFFFFGFSPSSFEAPSFRGAVLVGVEARGPRAFAAVSSGGLASSFAWKRLSPAASVSRARRSCRARGSRPSPRRARRRRCRGCGSPAPGSRRGTRRPRTRGARRPAPSCRRPSGRCRRG